LAASPKRVGRVASEVSAADMPPDHPFFGV
jgi:hypothetical protein